MRCALCSFKFDEKQARHSCCGCFKAGSCDLIKCPRCGYEVPPPLPVPKWIKYIQRFFIKKEQKK